MSFFADAFAEILHRENGTEEISDRALLDDSMPPFDVSVNINDPSFDFTESTDGQGDHLRFYHEDGTPMTIKPSNPDFYEDPPVENTQLPDHPTPSTQISDQPEQPAPSPDWESDFDGEFLTLAQIDEMVFN